jgi:hypothetical protein
MHCTLITPHMLPIHGSSRRSPWGNLELFPLDFKYGVAILRT